MNRIVDKKIDSLPNVVLLDWDGTLADSYGFLKTAHNYTRKQMGLPVWKNAEFKQIMRYSTREAFTRIYGDEAERAKDILFSYVDTHHADSMHLMDGAEELLRTMSNAGILLGIVSNKRHERLEADVKLLGWDKYISSVVGAGKAEYDKPAPDPLILALEEIGYDGEYSKVWYVGDTETDMEASKSAGTASILVLCGTGDASILQKYTPEYVFENLTDIIFALINKINHKKHE